VTNWTAPETLIGIGGFVISLLSVLFVFAKRLFLAVTPEIMTAAIEKSAAINKDSVDTRHAENARRFDSQDDELHDIKALIQASYKDAREARHELRDKVGEVDLRSSLLVKTVDVIEGRTKRLEVAVEDHAKKFEAHAKQLDEMASTVKKGKAR